jgi:hypothetical protein
MAKLLRRQTDESARPVSQSGGGQALTAGATRHARGFFATGRANAVWVGPEWRALGLLDATEDTPPFALAALGSLLLGDGLGPLPSLFVHTVRHGW